MTPFFKPLAIILTALFLTACESSEERAEKYYQSGLALLEEGDVQRALVEFRNVFKLNGNHREARTTYARLIREQGNTRDAYGQYLRLVEQYPDALEGRVALAELAFEIQNWDEMERHGKAAIKAAPERDDVKILAAAIAYRTAALEEDEQARRAALKTAETLATDHPDRLILQRMLIDGYIWETRFTEAMTQIDKALEQSPEDRTLYNARLSILSQLGNQDAVEAQLRNMVDTFPEDSTVKSTLVRYFMSRQESDKAEAFLRDISAPTDEELGTYLSLIQFLEQVRGTEAAVTELDSAIAINPDVVLFRGMKAGYDFQEGRRDQAIADLEAVLARNAPTADSTGPAKPEDLRNIKIALARMLETTGNEVGARRLVEAVLSDDPTQGDALRMQAHWMIQSDDTDGAIASLRAALDQNPQDANAMTLMAQAYTRAGSRELARDFLSLAVEASGNAPEESMRYARLLREEERYLPAEDVLITSLRVAPGNVGLLVELGRVYLQLEDIGRARQIVATLRKSAAPAAKSAADGMEAAVLAQQNNTGDAIAFLERLVADSDNDTGAKIAIIRARLSSGESEAALDYARAALEEEPGNATLRYVMATTLAATGDLESAEAGYRDLAQDFPDQPRIWVELARIKTRQGKSEDAKATIQKGLATAPDAPDLLWAKASYLEQDGEIDAAIEIYEGLYEKSSNSVVVANNLASLLSAQKEDAESLERAYTVARRLRGSDVPAFQDTYGWIAYRRGNYQEALEHLEPAAAGLPEDVLAQAHLGLTYAALDRTTEALEQLRKAVAIAGPGDTRNQIETARQEIVRLETMLAQ